MGKTVLLHALIACYHKWNKNILKSKIETLALVWACERFHSYLYGADFELVTEYKALEFILSTRSKPNARIERLVLRLQPCRYKVVYIASNKNIADSSSHLMHNKVNINISNFVSNNEYAKLIASYAIPLALITRAVEKATSNDVELCHIRDCIVTGNWQNLASKVYLPVRYELTFVGYVILRGTQIVMPLSLREPVLKLAHEEHPGISMMKRRLRNKVWGPGIDKNVESFCKKCYSRQLLSQIAPSEPMTRTELPKRPWQDLACDLLLY